MTTDARPRILVLNQYYWPGVEATAHLLSQLCEALAEDYDVTVVTGHLHGLDLPTEEERNGVRILRVRSTAYERSQLHLRAANYASYLGDTVVTALRGERPALVLCMTDPPVVGDIGLLVARRFGAPLLVISQDVFPEIAERVKRLEHPLVVGALRRLVGLYLRRADRVVAIGETMKLRLVQKGAPAGRIEVIPNWVDTAELAPQPRRNAWSHEQGVDDTFVVMHSGNIGHAQDLDTLVRAAAFLRDLDRLQIMVIGFGARHGELTRLAQRLEVTSTVRFLGYQPRDRLSLSLASADLHYVGLARGLSGFVVPSRLYGILAVARPVLVSADADSETVALVEEAGCGIVVQPGRPALVAGVIRDAVEGRLSLEGMGERGRAWVEREADREVAFDRYRRVVADVVSSSSR
ncbi:MAG TPA: glycosyltransferase family 4 protein [Gaiella sp.]|uniref:glycosyltransferase family 4 protein n=1 Tax=Gaiella sp. TaxID=2663207 RepID=UPI002D7E4ED4|nr:glycosyltransferase family 4 protein [Gaiella sp.]HET9289197.1 glycosyltransferase family 4 protein [Gaiella sp.]